MVEIEGFDWLDAGGSRQESHPQIDVEHHLIGVATTLVEAYLCNVQRRRSIYGILASHFGGSGYLTPNPGTTQGARLL